jgi:hypothetical protein
VIELKVDAQGNISGCVESAADESAEESGGGEGAEGGDDGMSEYTPFGSIKEALTWALGVYKNDGTAPESDADTKAFSSGYGMKSCRPDDGAAVSKAVFTFEDKDGQLSVSVDYGDEGLNKNSPAHKMTAIMTQWMKDLDSAPAEAPKLVFAAEEINQRRADMVRHLGKQPAVIHAPFNTGGILPAA